MKSTLTIKDDDVMVNITVYTRSAAYKPTPFLRPKM